MNEKIAVVMPVYNEEEIIGEVVDKWLSFLKKLGEETGSTWDLHIYNDGSRDKTLSILQKKLEHTSENLFLHNKKNSGHGPTILQGYKEAVAAGYDWIFQTDSDNEMEPEYLRELWAEKDLYDLLIGIRKDRIQTLGRKFVTFSSRLTVRLLFGKGPYDVNCPYRLMRAAAFRDFFPQLAGRTFAPNVILSGMAGQKKLRIFQMDVPQKERLTGECSMGNPWKLMNSSLLSFWQSMEFALKNSNKLWLLALFAIFSLVGKLYMASRGQTFDFGSYELVAGIMEKGGNVYGETHRYNYGPVWFHILWFLKKFSGEYFRYSIPLLLGLADIGIAALLWKLRYRLAALLFLISPLSWHITGFHTQFDVLAVLLAGISIVILMGKGEEEPPSIARTVFSAVFMGLSIITKHVFIFFPLWLLFRKYDQKRQCILFILPLFMFFASFLPYLYPFGRVTVKDMKEDCRILYTYGKEFVERNMETADMQKKILTHANGRLAPAYGIVQNVFLYGSGSCQILLRSIVPGVLHPYIPLKLLFYGGIILLGILWRRRDLFECFLFYTGALLLLSPAMADQYLAIPLAFACVYAYPFGLLYSIIPGGILILHQGKTAPEDLYEIAGLLLFLIFAGIYRKKIADLLEKSAHFLRKF